MPSSQHERKQAITRGRLALLIYYDFGRDLPAAAAAWRRLYQCSCSDAAYLRLLRVYRTWHLKHEPHEEPAYE